MLVDVALGLSVLTHSFMNVMYRGPLTTVEEQSCHQLLKSKLLQRLVEMNGDREGEIESQFSVESLTLSVACGETAINCFCRFLQTRMFEF